MAKGIASAIFNQGNAEYGVMWEDKTVTFSRTVIPDQMHYLQSVTTFHKLTYSLGVLGVYLNTEENMVYIETGHGIRDSYSFGEIESFFVGEEKEETDNVNHPAHYQSRQGIEVIDVIGAFTEDLRGMEAVCTANALKYTCRWKHKNGVEDLKKAIWYLNKLIDIKTKEAKQND